MNPITIVPIAPTASPAFLKAAGIARIPDPREDFNKCTREPIDLRKKIYYYKSIVKNIFKHVFVSATIVSLIPARCN